MVTITLYARQQKRRKCLEPSFVGMINAVSEVPETAFIFEKFFFFCSDWVISIILSSRSCMCSSVPPRLQLMRPLPSRASLMQ